jgi:tripeptidyl-peptidase-1
LPLVSLSFQFSGRLTFSRSVTAVGATQVKSQASVLDANPEEACETVIKSGGGFSNNFAMPAYQADAVNRYFDVNAPSYSDQTYNSSMNSRGYPDLSANGFVHFA